MIGPVVAEPLDDPIGDDIFDERNPFLDLLLGMISISERTLATVVDLADPRVPPAVERPRPPVPPGPILR
jgi:hypothetical protein